MSYLSFQYNRTRSFQHLKPFEKPPDLVVIHSMGEYVEGTYAVEFLHQMGLSAHALIRPDGAQEILALPSYKCAHAKQLNSRALGVEFLVSGNHNYASFSKRIQDGSWVTSSQWSSAVSLCKSWLVLLPGLRFVRHSDVDKKKVDPGSGFPWVDFLHDIGS